MGEVKIDLRTDETRVSLDLRNIEAEMEKVKVTAGKSYLVVCYVCTGRISSSENVTTRESGPKDLGVRFVFKKKKNPYLKLLLLVVSR